MTGGSPRTLADLAPVQADRIGTPEVRALLSRDAVDPYGHGADRAGRHRGIASADGVPGDPALTVGLLRGLDTALPDHILEALHHATAQGDRALPDFLGLIDRRLQRLQRNIDRQCLLVAEVDAGTGAGSDADADAGAGLPGLIGAGLARVTDTGAGMAAPVPVLLSLIGKSRNLRTLARLLGWLGGLPVQITPRFGQVQPVDPGARLRLAGRAGADGPPSPPLGLGAVLGARARTAQGRIEIDFLCRSAADLQTLRACRGPVALIAPLTARLLGDGPPVAFFARLSRASLAPPRLRRGARGLRLGAHGCLNPGAQPGAEVRLRLDLVRTPSTGESP